MANEFTKIAARYPFRYSLVVGVFVVVIFTTIYQFPLIAGLVSGLLFTIANWLIWRPGGLLRRREKHIPEGPINMRAILPAVAIGVAMFCLVFGVIWLAR